MPTLMEFVMSPPPPAPVLGATGDEECNCTETPGDLVY